jgi:ABC-type nickel/cobalt efflux system permease component RcnA
MNPPLRVRARRDWPRGSARRRHGRVAAAAGVLLAVVVPAVALAHPLGNFTINHFAALRVAPQRISLDVVIDRAEIPAFQEQQRLDTNGDGTLAPVELDGQRPAECQTLAADLHLAVGGAAVAPALVAAGLSLPPGAGGLSTMRLVCEFEAALAAPIAAGTSVTFEDRSFAERIGWREIVVLGDGVTVTSQTRLRGDAAGVSKRLTSYPTDLLTQPLDERSITVSATPGGPALPAWTAPDASALAGAAPATAIDAVSAVPGGIGENLAALVDVQDLTPLAILVSLAIAFALGIVHALSPGHGKTIMAAYLVGGRGSSRQAIGLGLAVTVSHTLGVLTLAGITLAASSLLPPERLYPVLGVASGGLVILIGASLLWARLRVALGRQAADHEHQHDDPLAPGLRAPRPQIHRHPHPHSHAHPPVHARAEGDDSISWRGLLALGLSGGLVPSASALILLLGSISAGRVAYGLVLVLGFGVGMAVVLAGIGLLLVHARRLVERRLAGGRASVAGVKRLVVPVQVATACLVVALGVVLTGQALTQVL